MYVLLFAIGGFAVCPSWAQVVQTAELDPLVESAPSDLVDSRERDTKLRGGVPSLADTLSLPVAHGVRERWTERKAREAARVDPGILLYVEPPAGTSMPTITPPDRVDPGMIWRPRPQSGATILSEKN